MNNTNPSTQAESRVRNNNTMKTKTGRWPVLPGIARTLHRALAALALLVLAAVALAQSDATLTDLAPRIRSATVSML